MRWGIGAGATALVASLLVFAPLAGAVTVILPPYKGSLSSPQNTFSTGCGGKGKWILMPQWNATGGKGGSSQQVSASSCSPILGGGSFALVQTQFSVAIPLHVSPGSHTITANVTMKVSGTQSVHFGGVCPPVVLDSSGNGHRYCSTSPQFSFQQTNAVIFDVTSNSYIYSPSPYGPNFYNYTYDYNDTSCSSFSCTYSNYSAQASTFPGNPASSSWNTSFSGTFAKSHAYYLVMTFYIEAIADVEGYPNTTASASINAATLGNGFAIPYIAIV